MHIVPLARMAETPHLATHPAEILVIILLMEPKVAVHLYPVLLVIIVKLAFRIARELTPPVLVVLQISINNVAALASVLYLRMEGVVLLARMVKGHPERAVIHQISIIWR